jgi:hypothetical protein
VLSSQSDHWEQNGNLVHRLLPSELSLAKGQVGRPYLEISIIETEGRKFKATNHFHILLFFKSKAQIEGR